MKRLGAWLKRNSVLSFIIVFSLLVVVIIAVMGGFLLRNFHARIEEDYYQKNALVLSAIENAHENEIQILEDISLQLNLSTDSTRFLLADQPLKSTPLRQHLTQYRAVNHFFDALFYYYQDDEYLYNHLTSMSLAYFCEKGFVFDACDPEYIGALLREPRRTMRVLPEQALSGTVLAPYNVASPSALYILPIAPEYDAIMVYFVGAHHFDALLSAPAEERRNSYIVYDGGVVARRGGEPVSDEEVLSLVQSGEGQFMARLEKGKYLATVAFGESGVRYCTLQSADLLGENLWTGSWSVLVILLALAIPASLLITAGAVRLLRRFRSINTLLNREEELYSFEAVQSGVQALMEESSKVRASSMRLRKTRFVRAFIRGDFQSADALRAEAEDAGFSLSHGLYCVVVIGNRYIENQKQLHEMVLRQIAERREVDGYGINLIGSSQTVLLLFGENYADILDFCQSIIDQGRLLNDDMVVAVSGPHDDIMTGSKAYIEADVAFSSRFLHNQNAPIRYEYIADRETGEPYPEAIKRLLGQFKNAIQLKRESDACKTIDEICDYLTQSRASLITFRFIFDDIQHILVLEWKGEPQDINQFYNVFALSQCLTIDDFRTLLKEASHLALSNDEERVRKLSDLVQESIDYMQENYRSPDLTMSALADHLNISPVTLSVEFKNEMSISPSEYLTSLRIAQAKELLQNSDMLVREVSAAVGYEDEHVFTRRFKKYTGTTPGQYRSDRRL